MIPRTRHAAKGEKETTISEEQLSFYHPAINLEKGGKTKSLCQFRRRERKAEWKSYRAKI
jgi:hypothetical protein